jgi:F0F1-type ATP synthase assembly protein I
MFGLGLIKGTIIGMGIGIVTAFALKEMCKMKKSNNSKGETEPNIDAS